MKKTTLKAAIVKATTDAIRRAIRAEIKRRRKKAKP